MVAARSRQEVGPRPLTGGDEVGREPSRLPPTLAGEQLVHLFANVSEAKLGDCRCGSAKLHVDPRVVGERVDRDVAGVPGAEDRLLQPGEHERTQGGDAPREHRRANVPLPVQRDVGHEADPFPVVEQRPAPRGVRRGPGGVPVSSDVKETSTPEVSAGGLAPDVDVLIVERVCGKDRSVALGQRPRGSRRPGATGNGEIADHQAETRRLSGRSTASHRVRRAIE